MVKSLPSDTPENLERQYTSTEVDVVCTQTEQLESILTQQGVSYDKTGNRMIFRTKNAPMVLEILFYCKETILDFEVKNGTLNEVFLAITGKEIRKV